MIRHFVIMILLVLPAFSWLLQPGYFSMHDDLQAVRQMEMDNCFKDGQIPCRWSKNLGYGFGYPLFNFYPPLPYLVGQIFRSFGLAYIDVVKVVGIVGFIATFWFMYLLGEKLWGKRGGLISAVIYTYAPYHSVDFYVRGAMNEFWAMAFFPAIFLCLYQLVNTRSPRYIPLTALSIAGLMLSHNPMLMIFAPIAVAWTLYWLWRTRSFQSLPRIILAGIWGFGLAAFFTLPVLLEQKFAHVETLTIGYFNFLAHYLDLNQIFLRINWGYGESILGSGDTMSFALGYLLWLIPATVILGGVFVKKLRPYLTLFGLLLLFSLLALFFSHSRSTPIWLKFKPLEFLQFPWRFLTLAVFSASLLSGAVILILNSVRSGFKFLTPILVVLILILNADYFRPRAWYPHLTDTEKFSGQSWRLQVTGSIFDYLPVYAPLPPPDPAGADLGITSGEGTFTTLHKDSRSQLYSLDIFTPTATAEIQTFYFPGWRVFLDGTEVGIDPARDQLLGRMQVDLTFGQHTLKAEFTDTLVRKIGNILSLIFWLAIPVVFFDLRRLKKSGMPSSGDVITFCEDWVKSIYPNSEHLIRTGFWVRKLEPAAPLALVVACVTHDIERAFPAGRNPPGSTETGKDITWDDPVRNLWHGQRSAEFTGEFLKTHGLPDSFIAQVKTLITSHEIGGSPMLDLIKDADSISFLEVNPPVFIKKIPDHYSPLQVKQKLDYMFDRIGSPRAKKIAAPYYRAALKKLSESFTI